MHQVYALNLAMPPADHNIYLDVGIDAYAAISTALDHRTTITKRRYINVKNREAETIMNKGLRHVKRSLKLMNRDLFKFILLNYTLLPNTIRLYYMLRLNKERTMRLEVGAIKLFSRAVLAGFATLVGIGFFNEICSHDPRGIVLARGAHTCIIYGVTLLAFASMPATRRSDIAKSIALVAVLIQLGRRVAGYDCDLLEVACDALGAYAVFVSSCIERFRALNRQDPHEPFSLVYPQDRRRRSKKPARAASLPG